MVVIVVVCGPSETVTHVLATLGAFKTTSTFSPLGRDTLLDPDPDPEELGHFPSRGTSESSMWRPLGARRASDEEPEGDEDDEDVDVDVLGRERMRRYVCLGDVWHCYQLGLFTLPRRRGRGSRCGFIALERRAEDRFGS